MFSRERHAVFPHDSVFTSGNAVLILCLAGVLPIIVLDLLVLRVHRRSSKMSSSCMKRSIFASSTCSAMPRSLPTSRRYSGPVRYE